MTGGLAEITLARIQGTHQMLLLTTKELAETGFAWVPGPQAPPIGWHLWHIARWTDRLQASFPAADGGAGKELWEEEKVVASWGLNPKSLGVLQSGLAMQAQTAAEMVEKVGQARIVDYAKRTFAACDAVLDRLAPTDFAIMRDSIRAFRIDGNGQIIATDPPQKTVADDLAFHLSHTNRHLGMIEGLRGALGLSGSASV